MPNPVVHFEVAGSDGVALQNFYRDLFGWRIDANNPLQYGIVEAEEGGIAGGISASPDGSKHVTFYVQVADPQAALDRAVALGGSVLMPVSEIPGADTTIALLSDPEGNMVGLVKG